jgi:hypothetical protein
MYSAPGDAPPLPCPPLTPQPNPGSAAICADEDDAGSFERNLNHLDCDFLHRIAALEPRHCVWRHLSRAGEAVSAPSKSRPRHPTLHWNNWIHDPTQPTGKAVTHAGLQPASLVLPTGTPATLAAKQISNSTASLRNSCCNTKINMCPIVAFLCKNVIFFDRCISATCITAKRI